MLRRSVLFFAITALSWTTISYAQTFDVNGQSTNSSSAQRGKARKGTPSPETGMGWGSSIEVARQARAAQNALQHGDYREAIGYAQHAADAAPQNPDLWFTLAYAARLAGQYPLSVDAYRRGLALQPSSIEGLSGLAQTYARMGKAAEAQQALQQVLAANPRSGKDLQLAGELLLPLDPAHAIEYLLRAEELGHNARNELLLARAYERTNKPDQAKQMLERARRSAPSNPEVLRAVAEYYRDSGDFDSAIATLKGLPTKDAVTLAELAYTYQLAGDKSAAAEWYVRAAHAAPKQVDIQLNAAQALVVAGQFDDASQMLEHAASLSPEHYRLHAVRGQMFGLQHRNADAIREYELALQRLPPSVPEGVLYPISLRVDLYELYRNEGDSANADRVAKEARAAVQGLDMQGANRPEFLRLRAATAMAAGDSKSAEADLKEALGLQPRNSVLLLNYAQLLWRTDRRDDAVKIYQQVLALDSGNAAALGSLGFLMREVNEPDKAREYFQQLAKRHPDDYVAYLALGDLDSATRQFQSAQTNYERAFQLAPSNPLIVSGAINAALEGHQPAVAKTWLDRSSEKVRNNPQVMRERERYLTVTGNYAESAELGYKVIELLPRDREAVDYLAYDLLFLKRYDEAMKIVERYEPVLSKDRDLPLIAGYVHAHDGEFQVASQDFTRALDIDPDMATGYMNRGYVYNDMRLAAKAERDFRKALSINPNYGEAHLGLAYALLQLRSSQAALKEALAAEKELPESESLHLAKAEAYRQRAMMSHAEEEYRAALKFNPNEPTTYLALADTQYRLRRYQDSADTLSRALSVSPRDAMVQAQLARSYARLNRSGDAMNSVGAAERLGGADDKVLLVTADALRIMGDRDAAMQRYSRALEASEDDRLRVRLALARLFAQEGKASDAQQQVAIGFAEARVAPSNVVTGDDYLNAADVLMSIHEYALAQRFYGRAETAGGDESTVAVGMANAYLALGDTRSAELQLASAGSDSDQQNSFDYLVARGNVYRQQGDTVRALNMFARAHNLDPEDPGVHAAEMELAEDEGRRISDQVSMSTQFQVAPLFEDENIYQMDARLLGFQNGGALLPTPRRSIESYADSRFRMHFGSFPVISGFVGERNARGSLSFPSELLIQNRNTYDTIFNGAISPNVRIGNVRITLTPGLQYTIRRDTTAPVPMNQNLFRQFLYVSTSPIGNWLSFSGNVIREAGPFTEQNLHSRDFSGTLDFRVGRPWGKTALLTGYNARDLLFGPAVHEYYETTTYAGLEQKFGHGITASAVAEYLRAWRVEGNQFAIAQSLRPRFGVTAPIGQHWSVSATGSWSQGKGFHAYDNVTSGFLISYVRERRVGGGGDTETASIGYPMRFSFGAEQQTFYAFPGHGRTAVVPVLRFTLF